MKEQSCVCPEPCQACKAKLPPTRTLAQIEETKGEPIPTYGDHMPLEEFLEACESGGFVDYDGSGYYASETEMFGSMPIRPSMWRTADRSFTHVVWFNK